MKEYSNEETSLLSTLDIDRKNDVNLKCSQDDNSRTTMPVVKGSTRSHENLKNRPLSYVEKQVRRHRFHRYLSTILCACCVFITISFVVKTILYHYDLSHGRISDRRVALAAESIKRLNQKYHNLLASSNSAKHHKNVDLVTGVAELGCVSTVLIIRHCEKQDNDKDSDPKENDVERQEDSEISSQNDEKYTNEASRHCSHNGYLRSLYLPTLFGSSYDSRWPPPTNLFALTSSRHGHTNFREFETLVPLRDHLLEQDPIKIVSIQLIAPNQIEFSNKFYDSLVNGSLCGKVSLICWKHSLIPDLASSLGCSSENGCPSYFDKHEFDQVWELKYVLSNEVAIPHNVSETLSEFEVVMNGNEVTKKGTGMGPRPLDGTQPAAASNIHDPKKVPTWNMYGSVTYEYFDPIEYSSEELF